LLSVVSFVSGIVAFSAVSFGNKEVLLLTVTSVLLEKVAFSAETFA
jgi:hypothetical protein